MFDILSDELFWKLGGAFVILLVVIYQLVLETLNQKLKVSELEIKKYINEDFKKSINEDLAKMEQKIEHKIEKENDHVIKNVKNLSNIMDHCFDKKIEELKKIYEK